MNREGVIRQIPERFGGIAEWGGAHRKETNKKHHKIPETHRTHKQ